MSDEKKHDDGTRIDDEQLKDVSGGTKYGNITLKRGVINTTEPSDPSTLTGGQDQAFEPDGVEHQDNWREQN